MPRAFIKGLNRGGHCFFCRLPASGWCPSLVVNPYCQCLPGHRERESSCLVRPNRVSAVETQNRNSVGSFASQVGGEKDTRTSQSGRRGPKVSTGCRKFPRERKDCVGGPPIHPGPAWPLTPSGQNGVGGGMGPQADSSTGGQTSPRLRAARRVGRRSWG